MKKFEYKEVRYISGSDSLISVLNREGQEGWNYCDRLDLLDLDGYRIGYRLILKREIDYGS